MQADILFLRRPSGRWIYQLTVCGPVSSLTAAELVTTPSVRNIRAAFGRILETFPVVIPGVQTDNGSEFRCVFEELIQERGMVMQVLQPCSPKQDGCVGRCQCTWRRRSSTKPLSL